uniref:Uncharacterized protein n=1 Tax=Acrobeloides nanus TaxID=290746 RepID=A0A914C871_9BILA
MYFILLSTLIIFLGKIGLCTGQNNCSLAGINTIQSCYATYFQFLNLTFINGSAPNYNTYGTVLSTYLSIGGVPDYSKLCVAQNTMIKCFANYDPNCVNTNGFQKALGVPAEDANEYLVNLGVIKWDCNAGYGDMVNNWNCLQNLWDLHFDEIAACGQYIPPNFNMTGFSCLKGVSIIQCYKNAYGKYCGSVGGYIGCEFARSGLNELDSNCESQYRPCTK